MIILFYREEKIVKRP